MVQAVVVTADELLLLDLARRGGMGGSRLPSLTKKKQQQQQPQPQPPPSTAFFTPEDMKTQLEEKPKPASTFLTPADTMQPSSPSAPVCRQDLMQAGMKLVLLNEEVLQVFLDTTLLLNHWPKVWCNMEQFERLLQQINWDQHARFAEQRYSESLARCVNSMLNKNKIDTACMRRAEQDRNDFIERDEAIRDQLRRACKEPVFDNGDDKDEQPTYKCGEREISASLRAWLADTRDNLMDKRLVCFLKGGVLVKQGDKVGTHTVYRLENQVAGVAIPKDKKQQVTTGSSSIGNILAVGIRSMQHLFSLLLNSIALLTKLAACGLEWALSKLWIVRMAAVMVLLSLLSSDIVTPENVIQLIKDYALEHMVNMVQVMQKLCSIGFSPAALGAYIMVSLKVLEGLPQRQMAMMGSIMLKVFIPLFTVVCALKYVNFESLGMSLPGLEAFTAFWSSAASAPGMAGSVAGDIPLGGTTSPMAAAAMERAATTLQDAVASVNITEIPDTILEQGNTLFSNFVDSYVSDAAATTGAVDALTAAEETLIGMPVTDAAADAGASLLQEAQDWLAFATVVVGLQVIRLGQAAAKVTM